MLKISAVFRHHHPTETDKKGKPVYIEGGRIFFQVRQYREAPHPVSYREGKKVRKTTMRNHLGRETGYWDDVPGALFETEEEAQAALQEIKESAQLVHA